MNTVAAIAGTLVLVYLGVTGFLWLVQPYLVFQPGPPPRHTPADAGLAYEPATLNTADGLALSAWWVPGPQENAPVLLFLHGNAGNLADRLESLRQFHAAGAATLILDYRGFGDSPGVPTERGTHIDALAAWRWLTVERRIPRQRIVIFGRSLGGAVAARLAARRRAAGLILESTFTSLPDLAADHYPWMPARWLTKFDFATARHLAAVEAPVLLAHAPGDEIVPYAHALRLARMRPPVEEFIELEGGHNDAFLASQPEYTRRIAAFLERVTADAPP